MATTGVKPDVSAHATVKTRTHLAPVALQGLGILALPVAALPDYLTSMAEQNPMLELNYDDDLFRFDELPSESSYEDALERAERENAEPIARHFETLPGIAAGQEWDFSRIQSDVQETETLQEFLRFQACDLHLCEADFRIMESLIENVNDDGFFEGDMAVIAFNADCPASRAEELLAILQTFQPAGVGARSIGECLKLQIDPRDPYADAMRRLLDECLDDLAAGRLAACASHLGISMEDMAVIKRTVLDMNPRPGASFYQRPRNNFIVPDIVVSRHGSDFSVKVVGAASSCLSLSAEYVRMLQEANLMKEARAYLAEKYDEATKLLAGLDQRRQTLQRFGVFLVERQFKYFMTGGGSLAPLTMQQAAEALDVHVSTISRTVQGKYIQTPWGVFPLKMFFTRALPRTVATTEAGPEKAAVSSFEIKQMIKEIIDGENRDKPLSDAKITELLNANGVDIKRRTVAKYRESMGIAVQSKRRWA